MWIFMCETSTSTSKIIVSTFYVMRPCLNELQKEYCVKTKVIALDCQWVTHRSWCQMNRNGHSSPVNHKVEGKPHFFVKYFLVTSVHICIYPNTNDITPILHTCLTLCWSYLRSTEGYLVVLLWFWVVLVNKKKTRASSWFQGEINFFENLVYNYFFESHWQ